MHMRCGSEIFSHVEMYEHVFIILDCMVWELGSLEPNLMEEKSVVVMLLG